jgi:sirohydrochlorin cobaltochelatase
MAAHGMVLFGHGARDVRWREPFERLADKLRVARGSDADARPVLLAAVGALVSDGCSVVTVVPVFFGQGGHVRKDLPDVIERCRGLYPGVEIKCATAVGEDEAVLDAVVEYCLRQV